MTLRIISFLWSLAKELFLGDKNTIYDPRHIDFNSSRFLTTLIIVMFLWMCNSIFVQSVRTAKENLKLKEQLNKCISKTKYSGIG